MTDRINPSTLTDTRDQAAYWHTRLQSDEVSDEERAAFEQWRQADPRNAACYRQVLRIWAIADTLPKSEVRKLGARRQAPPPRKKPYFGKPGWGYALALACTTTLIFVLLDPLGQRDLPGYQSEFITAHGEQRRVVLPDDSVLTLNTDTTATVRFFENRRTVHLARGEALFQVDGAQGTPFTVDVDTGTVRVTGTRFNVRRETGEFSVGVLEGSVDVKSGPWWRRQAATLRPGDIAHAPAAGDLSIRNNADVDSAVAWQEGKLVFHGVPLTDAVKEVNRYADRRLIVPDANTARLRLSGVFSTNDPAAFLAALPRIVPVTIREPAEGPGEILPR